MGREFETVYARRFGETGESPSGIVLGEHYFFKAENDAVVLIMLDSLSPGETKVGIISCAGGNGLLEVSCGAHSAYVSDVKNYLTDSGFDVLIEEEIPYFCESSS
jgi:predicted component of type VI protein secretion system